jgi:hypothetical protein
LFFHILIPGTLSIKIFPFITAQTASFINQSIFPASVPSDETITDKERRNKMETKGKPDKKFKAGAVSATIWANEMRDKQGKGFLVYTVAFERTYMDKDGAWKSTSSLRVNDIPKLQLVAHEAYEYLVRKGNGDNEI